LAIHALVAKIQPDKVVQWCADGKVSVIFLHPVFSASRVQHVSDLHLKLTLKPHHVWKYGEIQSATDEIRRGKKERKKKKKPQCKNIMACPILYGSHNKWSNAGSTELTVVVVIY